MRTIVITVKCPSCGVESALTFSIKDLKTLWQLSKRVHLEGVPA
jgi:hypothetical protein